MMPFSIIHTLIIGFGANSQITQAILIKNRSLGVRIS